MSCKPVMAWGRVRVDDEHGVGHESGGTESLGQPTATRGDLHGNAGQ
jgi:hypothetical protein